MRIKCINNKNRPAEFPLSKWLKEGEFYTPIAYLKSPLMPNGGFKLAEIDTKDCLPYLYFDATRFAPLDEVDLLLIEVNELETA